jgi:hypothetical protein
MSKLKKLAGLDDEKQSVLNISQESRYTFSHTYWEYTGIGEVGEIFYM